MNEDLGGMNRCSVFNELHASPGCCQVIYAMSCVLMCINIVFYRYHDNGRDFVSIQGARCYSISNIQWLNTARLSLQR